MLLVASLAERCLDTAASRNELLTESSTEETEAVKVLSSTGRSARKVEDALNGSSIKEDDWRRRKIPRAEDRRRLGLLLLLLFLAAPPSRPGIGRGGLSIIVRCGVDGYDTSRCLLTVIREDFNNRSDSIPSS